MRTHIGVYSLPQYEARNMSLIETGITMPLHFVSRHEEGVTHEAVIAALINDLTEKNMRVPCDENKLAIHFLNSALRSLENRHADRQERGVAGTGNF
jgi:hypothetical protein